MADYISEVASTPESSQVERSINYDLDMAIIAMNIIEEDDLDWTMFGVGGPA